jgi:hypothetical protein
MSGTSINIPPPSPAFTQAVGTAALSGSPMNVEELINQALRDQNLDANWRYGLQIARSYVHDAKEKAKAAGRKLIAILVLIMLVLVGILATTAVCAAKLNGTVRTTPA